MPIPAKTTVPRFIYGGIFFDMRTAGNKHSAPYSEKEGQEGGAFPEC